MLIIAALGVTASVAVWRARATAETSGTGLKPDAGGASSMVWHRRKQLPPPPHSPLGNIDFQAALKGDALPESVGRFGRESLNYSLALANANLIVQSIEAGERIWSLNIVYEFSANGKKMVESGVATIARHSASGEYLPTIQDHSGRFVELAKGRADLVGRLANISALIVSVAHIIASADTVKRLKRIETKLDQLLAGRKNDQLAKLERIYVRAGAVMNSGRFGHRNLRLEQYKDELYELRAGWRREVERILGIAPEVRVEEWWNHPNFRSVLKWSPPLGWGVDQVVDWAEGKQRERKERELIEHLMPLIEIVCCLRLALLIDICIAQWTGSVKELYSHTLRNEEAMWDEVTRILDSGKGRAAVSERLDPVNLIIGAVEEYVETLKGAPASLPA